jgi:hypothetical protein
MSALLSKADMCSAPAHVSYGPEADMKNLASAKKKPRILHTECGVGVRRPSPVHLWGETTGKTMLSRKPRTSN